MNIEEFKNNIEEYLIKLNVNLTSFEKEQLYIYMNEILKWNEKINLTAIKEENEFIVKHFIDSLTINKYLQKYQDIIDIGTGAGFPGIPLAIANKNKKFLLIDSVNKKLNVIKDINEKLKLNNVDIIHTRAEDLANKESYREKYDVATTRAVSSIPTILEYMLPFLKIGGQAICMKGPNYEEELNESKSAIKILGGKFEKVENIKMNSLERNIIIIEKVSITPKKYPRGQGKPLREPIK